MCEWTEPHFQNLQQSLGGKQVLKCKKWEQVRNHNHIVKLESLTAKAIYTYAKWTQEWKDISRIVNPCKQYDVWELCQTVFCLQITKCHENSYKVINSTAPLLKKIKTKTELEVYKSLNYNIVDWSVALVSRSCHLSYFW